MLKTYKIVNLKIEGVINLEDIHDKYFVNRLGYINREIDEECNDLYEVLGFEKINITKKNKKTFRTDRDSELYKKVPSDWCVWSEELLHRKAMFIIAKNIKDRESWHSQRIKKAFSMLSEHDKGQVCKWLKENAVAQAKKEYRRAINSFDIFLSKRNSWGEVVKEDFVNKYYDKKTGMEE
jgi:hypothetical protein